MFYILIYIYKYIYNIIYIYIYIKIRCISRVLVFISYIKTSLQNLAPSLTLYIILYFRFSLVP